MSDDIGPIALALVAAHQMECDRLIARQWRNKRNFVLERAFRAGWLAQATEMATL